MAKSSVTITFNSIPLVGDQLDIENSLIPLNPISETFVTTRDANYKAKIGSTKAQCAYNYYLALIADYNGFGTYDISQSGNQVSIEALQSNVVFTELFNGTSGRVTTFLTNEVEDEPIDFIDITFSQADYNPSKTIKVNVETNNLATSVTSPVTIVLNADNPFSFNHVRDADITLTVSDGSTSKTTIVTLPSALTTARTSVNIFNTPTGANVSVSVTQKYLLELQYSLDGVAWRTSNTFNGLVEGEYTMYVKDQFGGLVTVGFSVNIFTPDISVFSAYSYIADEMSIRYKENVEWDNVSIYKTEQNTLSCEERVLKNGIAYPYIQKFKPNHLITTQLLSNYSNISANVINEDGSKDAITIVKRSTNIGATDKRDAKYYNAENGQTGIYFVDGNTYNYTTGVINGTYELYGALPNYAAIGNYIYLEGIGWNKIIDIIYNDNLSSDVLLVDYEYLGEIDDIIVSAIFNREIYDVYEFNIDMAEYENKYIQVEILQSDNTFGTKNYLSEVIYVSSDLDDAIELKWYNPTDTSVYYSTGIINYAMLENAFLTTSNDSELSIHKTDDTALLTSATKYKSYDFKIEKISTAIESQITSALLHKELYINGVKYVSNSAPESENVQGTNMYNVTGKLTKTGNVYNAELDGSGNSIEGVELIGLLQSDSNYIKLG